MATNKHALIRYRTIDKSLQNRSKRWTLQDLIDACNDALYEYEGKDTLVSKRTVQLDIQMMRSNKLGYNAPIVVYDRKYYTYEDDTYTITKLPIDTIDMDILQESVDMLSQFKDFSLFSQLSGVIQKLEDKIYRESQAKAPIIYLDKNEDLKGLEHIDPLYHAIQKKIVLDISYKSFKSRNDQVIVLHPYLLREYNNRWFLIGRMKQEKPKILTLALDRILSFQMNLKETYLDEGFDAESYYKDTIGVTVLSKKQLVDAHLKIGRHNAPYVLTKPFHPSQTLLETYPDRSILISVKVHNNFEFRRLLLGFGSDLEVMHPRWLRSQIKKEVKQLYATYNIQSNVTEESNL